MHGSFHSPMLKRHIRGTSASPYGVPAFLTPVTFTFDLFGPDLQVHGNSLLNYKGRAKDTPSASFLILIMFSRNSNIARMRMYIDRYDKKFPNLHTIADKSPPTLSTTARSRAMMGEKVTLLVSALSLRIRGKITGLWAIMKDPGYVALA